MAKINEHYLKLKASYLFSDIAKRIRAFTEAHPDARIIRLGIGDVTQPLPPAVIKAMHEAVDEMAKAETFHCYGPDYGYDFLISLIAKHDYGARGVSISPDEIVVSDGSKSDSGNIQEIFAADATIALTDPVYPVYMDSNVMAGRAGVADAQGRYDRVVYLPCTAENGFQPPLPDRPVDMVYLCFPNNPTGSVLTKAQLKTWVDWARGNGAVLLFDAAYEAYIRDPEIPHSIYEVEGAREVAIEFRSFSKSAGFTGTRCAYTVVPKDVMGRTAAGERVPLNSLWMRRQSTKFNSVPYVIQKAAAAIYTEEGQREVRGLVDFYLGNAKLIREAVKSWGFSCIGGDNAPYLWINTGRDSWEFFDLLLNNAQVVCTPGAGFGKCGEGHVRISAFNSRANVEQALERIGKALK